MVRQTIAERIPETRNPAARHILQDEAAKVGAQGLVSEQLEAKLLQAATQYLQPTRRSRVAIEQVEAFVESGDRVTESYPVPSRREHDSEPVQWLRGLACARPVEQYRIALSQSQQEAS